MTVAEDALLLFVGTDFSDSWAHTPGTGWSKRLDETSAGTFQFILDRNVTAGTHGGSEIISTTTSADEYFSMLLAFPLGEPIVTPANRFQLTPDLEVGANSTSTSANDSFAYEMGTRFSVDTAAECYAIKFHRPFVNNTSSPSRFDARTWTVRLWREDTSALLGTATVNSVANQSGWLTAVFSTPIALSTGIQYIASFTNPGVGYNATSGFFSGPVVPGGDNPLAAPVNAGTFNETTGSIPVTSFGAAYYYVQPVVDVP